MYFTNFIAGQEWFFLIIIGIIAAVVISAIRKRKNKDIIVQDNSKNYSTSIKEQNEKSLKILKERLAKGEIKKDEYENLKKEFEN